jgi:hypothetical protein
MVSPQDFSNSSSIDLTFSRAGNSIHEELMMCQRYFWALLAEGSTGVPFAPGFAVNTTSFTGTIRYPVKMRATPTISSGSTATDFRLDGTSLITTSVLPSSSSGTNTNITGISATVASGLVAGQGYNLIANTGAAARIYFDAELY